MLKKVYAIEKEFFSVVELVVLSSSDDFIKVSFSPCLNVVAFRISVDGFVFVDDVGLNWFYKDVFVERFHASLFADCLRYL